MKNLFYVFTILFGLSLSNVAYPENYTMCSAPTVINATSSSGQVLAANAARTYIIVVNKSATIPAQLKWGAVQSGTEGIPVPPGGAYEPYRASTQSLFAVTASSTAALTIVQCNGG